MVIPSKIFLFMKSLNKLKKNNIYYCQPTTTCLFVRKCLKSVLIIKFLLPITQFIVIFTSIYTALKCSIIYRHFIAYSLSFCLIEWLHVSWAHVYWENIALPFHENVYVRQKQFHLMQTLYVRNSMVNDGSAGFMF